MTGYVVTRTSPYVGPDVLNVLTGSPGPPGTAQRRSSRGESHKGAPLSPWLTVKEAADERKT